MKRKWAALMALLSATAILVTGCQSDGQQTSEPSSSSRSSVLGPAKGDPKDFVIYRPPETNNIEWLKIAIARFNESYRKELNIIIEDFNSDREGFQTRTATELMAGEGPDILFTQSMDVNPHKAMQNNVFLDLSPYLEQDEDFNKEDYLNNIFEAGSYNGKQYIVPVSVSMPMVISNTSKLEEIGITEAFHGSMADFLKMISEASVLAEQKPGFNQMMPYKGYFSFFCIYSDIRLIDYAGNQVCPDEEALRDFFESYKMYFPYDSYEKDMGFSMWFNSQPVTDSHYFEETMDGSIGTCSLMKGYGGYTLSMLGNAEGEPVASYQMSAAVRANTQNPDYAYQFIKILLSQDIQMDIADDNGVVLPVYESAVPAKLKRLQSIFTTGNKSGDYIRTSLTDEEIQSIVEQFTNIAGGSIRDQTAYDMAKEAMTPYFKDEKSYEACFEELKSRLRLYLFE